MIDESKYENAMQIVALAGTAKSAALTAIDAAEKGDFDAAAQALAQAREQMGQAHDVQFSMISAEAAGNPVDVNVMLVHAEDHLAMAIVTIDLAERLIALYRRLEG